MSYPMRRGRQRIPKEECHEILAHGSEGVLSLIDPDGMPYGVPLNYVFDDNAIIFHCAKKGRKLECIEHNPHASFCVIGANDVVPEEFTTYYRDVIVTGTIKVIDDENDQIDALRKLGLKYYENPKACDAEIAKGLAHCLILALDISEVSGKEAIELTRARNDAN